MRQRFSEEELQIAKSVDLVAVAEYMGYTPKRVGNYYTLREMDSVRIYDRTNWYRFSRPYEKGENGGTQIDFLRVFANMDVKTAVFWLLDFAGYSKKEPDAVLLNQAVVSESTPKEVKPFILPEANHHNAYLYDYLEHVRGLSREVIDWFVEQELIYEDRKYHNIVFKGFDKDGVVRYASKRGTFDAHGNPFKGDVEGSNKKYGFNVVNKESHELFVFEAAIDLMSYVDIFKDYESNKLALGMLHDAPLETFLEENPNISSITFCLDNDERGQNAEEHLIEKYYGLGFEVDDFSFPEEYKDINEWLVGMRDLKCTKNHSRVR